MPLPRQAPMLARKIVWSCSSNLTRFCSSHASLPSQSIEQFGVVERHGPGDSVITLNVGGKNFLTLRSTIAQNAVLEDYVTRAQMNNELSQGAVFIDRDPKHFGMILSYLRNRADGVSTGSTGIAAGLLGKSSNVEGSATAAASVYLPSDQQSLQEMYYESIHFQIPELSSHICSKQFLSKYLRMSGSKNPFEMASGALSIGRRVLVFLGTVVTGMGGWVVTQATLSEVQTRQSFDARNCENTTSNSEQLLQNLVRAWNDSAGKN
ncbi:hypothetical protein HJC23_002392 [Cyclotella cryptica]|uniref:Potassium channel tetramerisation-type BTB domain-containing protein n=1 Tax=Cyclotella cryptica TaxID=29204 RepID=A0ABD3QKY2_9STRA|eukprot:CCRYP_004492-RA/>CCRYP_004492-RA protein AED:0.18 eAED:-0.02 QI:0/-1/0/1/-1/1/1/0/264